MKIKNAGILTITLFLLIPAVVKADVFYTPGQYNEIYHEKIALELEIKSLKNQYSNEKRNLTEQIRQLENRISDLDREIENLKKKNSEEKNLCTKRIGELERSIDILKKSGSEKEKSLIEENRNLSKRYEAELLKLRDTLNSERENNLKEISEIRNGYEKKIASLMTEIANLNSELSEVKKLNEEQKAKLSRMNNQANELEKQLENEIRKGEIRLKKFHDRLIINIDDKISFDSGKSKLKKNVLPSLRKIRKILSQYPEYTVIIEGHTDNVPIKSRKFRNNWQLSTERALSVLDYILKDRKLNQKRFSAAGYSKYRPIVPNDTKANRALNRRVDIVVRPMIKKAN